MASAVDDDAAHSSPESRRRFVAVAIAAVTLDLSSKVAASAWLNDRDVALPGPLDLRLAHNPGVAFGLADTAPGSLVLLATSAVAVLLGAAAWRGRFRNAIGPGLVLGGAVANIVDRLEAGTVVDMLHLGWWPTFNLADVWITAGAGLLLVGEVRASRRDRPEVSTGSAARSPIPSGPGDDAVGGS